MAAPLAAGAAALLAEKHPDWHLFQMEVRLQGTASAIKNVPAGAAAREFGAGVLNVGAALAPDFVPLPNQDPPAEEIRPR